MTLWPEVEPGADPARARRLLSCELLVEAGVREIRKDERDLPWTERDPWTEAALARGVDLLTR